MVNYASCLHATYIANNIRIIIILFFGRVHLQMNKTSVTTLYLYAFLFTLSAWLCDVTFTANRSCTLVGCGYVLRISQDHIPRIALRWTPTGKCSKGSSKTTWRKSIIAELSDMGLTMDLKRPYIVALCPTRDSWRLFHLDTRNH